MALGRQTDIGVRYVLDVTDNTRSAVAADAKVRASAQATGRVLKAEQAAQVNRLRQQGMSYAAIGRQMGFSATKARQLATATEASSKQQITATRRVEAADRSRAATSRRTAASVTRDHRGILSSWGTMTRRIIGYGAAIGSAYLGFNQAKTAITNTQALAKQTSFLTRQTGIDVKTSSEWAAIAKQRGIEAKSLNTVMATLSKNTVAAQKGGDAQLATFKALGITQAQLKAAGDDYNELLGLVADSLAATEGGMGRNAAASKLLGKGFQTLEPILAGGRKEMEAILQRADEMGATFTEKTLPAQIELIKSQRDLKLAGIGVQVAFTKAITPALQDASDAAVQLAEVLNDDRLTPTEKFEKIKEVLGDMIPDDLPEDIARSIGKAAPEVIAEFHHLAGVGIRALLDAFGKADIGTQLAVLSVAGWRFGVFGAVAKKAASTLLDRWRGQNVGNQMGSNVATQTANTTSKQLPGRMRGAMQRLRPVGIAGGALLGGALVTGAGDAFADKSQNLQGQITNFFSRITAGILPEALKPVEQFFDDMTQLPGKVSLKDLKLDLLDAKTLKSAEGYQAVLEKINQLVPQMDDKMKALGLRPFQQKQAWKGVQDVINEAAGGLQKYGDKDAKTFVEANRNVGKYRVNAAKQLTNLSNVAADKGKKTEDAVAGGSKRAKDAVDTNFGKLPPLAQKWLDQMNATTDTGIGKVIGALASALSKIAGAKVGSLSVAGQSAKDASKAVTKARGGWFQGTGLEDNILALVAPEEAILTRHDQPEVNAALAFYAAMGGGRHGSLAQLFSGARRKHSDGMIPQFATGGSVSGDTGGLVPKFMTALRAMSASTGTGISVTSGWRSRAEQSALYAAYLNGTGNLAAPPGSSHHELGIAADIAPGRPAFGGVAGKFGLGFTVPSESWHIELVGALSAAAARIGGVTAEKIARVLVGGPDGQVKQIAQAAIDSARNAGNSRIDYFNDRVLGAGEATPKKFARGGFAGIAGRTVDAFRAFTGAEGAGPSFGKVHGDAQWWRGEIGLAPRDRRALRRGARGRGVGGYRYSYARDALVHEIAHHFQQASGHRAREGGAVAFERYAPEIYRLAGLNGLAGRGQNTLTRRYAGLRRRFQGSHSGAFTRHGQFFARGGFAGRVPAMAKGGILGRISRLPDPRRELPDSRAPKEPKQREFKPPKGASDKEIAAAQEKYDAEVAKEQKAYQQDLKRFQDKQKDRIRDNRKLSRKQDRLIGKFTDGLSDLSVGALTDLDTTLEAKIGRSKGKRKKMFQGLLNKVDTRLTNVSAGAVDQAEFGVSTAQQGLERLGLEQQISGIFETQAGGQARAAFITSQIIPAMQAQLAALNQQLSAAGATGDAELARQIALAIGDVQNGILEQQLEAQEATQAATEEAADALKQFSGTTGFDFHGAQTDNLAALVGVGTGA